MVIIRMWLYFPLRWFYDFLLTLVLWLFITMYLGYSLKKKNCAGPLSCKCGGSFLLLFLWLSLHFLFLFSAILEVFLEFSVMTTCDQYIEFSRRLLYFSCIVVLILVGFYVLPTYHFNFEKDYPTVKQKLNKEYM